MSFEELTKALEEFGVVIRRPPFLDDKGNAQVVSQDRGGYGG